MLVFAVIQLTADEVVNDDTSKKCFRSAMPLDYIIVKESHFQLPLGMLSFMALKDANQIYSQDPVSFIVASQILLNTKEVLATKLATIAEKVKQKVSFELKTCIIQDIKQDIIYKANKMFTLNKARLSETDQKEISFVMHDSYGSMFCKKVFPGLPPPFTKEEYNCHLTKSIEYI
jgi:hypothetical protein